MNQDQQFLLNNLQKMIQYIKQETEKKVSNIKKEKIEINNELIRKQYKIIKDFLTPILKEENARQLISCYSKKVKKDKSTLLKRNKKSSLKNRALLDYSFLNENPNNKTKIPLFQILFPKQYKKHIEKQNKEKINSK